MKDKSWRPDKNKLEDQQLAAHPQPTNPEDDERSITGGRDYSDPGRTYSRKYDIPTPDASPNVPRDLDILGSQTDSDVTDLNSRTHAAANRVDTNTDNIYDTADIAQSHRAQEGEDQMGQTGDPKKPVSVATTTATLKKHPHNHKGLYSEEGHKHPASGDGSFPGYSEIGHEHSEYDHGHPYVVVNDFKRWQATGPMYLDRLEVTDRNWGASPDHVAVIQMMGALQPHPPRIVMHGLYQKDEKYAGIRALTDGTLMVIGGKQPTPTSDGAQKILAKKFEVAGSKSGTVGTTNLSDIDFSKVVVDGLEIDLVSLQDAGFPVEKIDISKPPSEITEEEKAQIKKNKENGVEEEESFSYSINDLVAFLVHKVQEQDKEIQQLKSKVK